MVWCYRCKSFNCQSELIVLKTGFRIEKGVQYNVGYCTEKNDKEKT